MKNLENLVKLLEENHQFPGNYTFKFVIPKTSEEHAAAVFKNQTMERRESKKGNYLSLTIDYYAQNTSEIVRMYDEASKIQGILSL